MNKYLIFVVDDMYVCMYVYVTEEGESNFVCNAYVYSCIICKCIRSIKSTLDPPIKPSIHICACVLSNCGCNSTNTSHIFICFFYSFWHVQQIY